MVACLQICLVAVFSCTLVLHIQVAATPTQAELAQPGPSHTRCLGPERAPTCVHLRFPRLQPDGNICVAQRTLNKGEFGRLHGGVHV